MSASSALWEHSYTLWFPGCLRLLSHWNGSAQPCCRQWLHTELEMCGGSGRCRRTLWPTCQTGCHSEGVLVLLQFVTEKWVIPLRECNMSHIRDRRTFSQWGRWSFSVTCSEGKELVSKGISNFNAVLLLRHFICSGRESLFFYSSLLHFITYNHKPTFLLHEATPGWSEQTSHKIQDTQVRWEVPSEQSPGKGWRSMYRITRKKGELGRPCS